MSDEMICKACGHVGDAERITKGNIWIELILWLAFLIPGLIYSIWRISTRHDACKKCGGTTLLPLDTPLGKKLANEVGYKPAVSQPSKPPSQTAINAGRALGRLFSKKS